MGYFDDTKFDCMYDMMDTINTVVRRNVADNMDIASAADCGLDNRCGRVYVNQDFIAVDGDGRSLDYYGGFEYVDRDYVTVMGEFKFYSAEDDRVREAIEAYFERQNVYEDAE